MREINTWSVSIQKLVCFEMKGSILYIERNLAKKETN